MGLDGSRLEFFEVRQQLLEMGKQSADLRARGAFTATEHEQLRAILLAALSRFDETAARKKRPDKHDVKTEDEARALMETLPLAKENLMDHEYIPVGPLMPLRALNPGAFQ